MEPSVTGKENQSPARLPPMLFKTMVARIPMASGLRLCAERYSHGLVIRSPEELQDAYRKTLEGAMDLPAGFSMPNVPMELAEKIWAETAHLRPRLDSAQPS
jgi:hypothetical protein